MRKRCNFFISFLVWFVCSEGEADAKRDSLFVHAF